MELATTPEGADLRKWGQIPLDTVEVSPTKGGGQSTLEVDDFCLKGSITDESRARGFTSVPCIRGLGLISSRLFHKLPIFMDTSYWSLLLTSRLIKLR